MFSQSELKLARVSVPFQVTMTKVASIILNQKRILCSTNTDQKTVLDSVAPVSYTHLDVYKRQGCMAGLAAEEHKNVNGGAHRSSEYGLLRTDGCDSLAQ